jgi:hypothetical protein
MHTHSKGWRQRRKTEREEESEEGMKNNIKTRRKNQRWSFESPDTQLNF